MPSFPVCSMFKFCFAHRIAQCSALLKFSWRSGIFDVLSCPHCCVALFCPYIILAQAHKKLFGGDDGGGQSAACWFFMSVPHKYFIHCICTLIMHIFLLRPQERNYWILRHHRRVRFHQLHRVKWKRSWLGSPIRSARLASRRVYRRESSSVRL